MDIDRREIARYLGYRGREPDAAIRALIEESLRALADCAAPRTLSQTWPLECPAPGMLRFAGLTVRSARLAAHVRGCGQVIVFAATLGAEVDRLLQQTEREAVSRAVVVQACAAAMIETVCEREEAALTAAMAVQGLYPRPRYSPGYGDFLLTHQADLLRILGAGKRIGLTLTAGGMLVPTKSVTALIGLSVEPQPCRTHACAACDQGDCPFRRMAAADGY